jgi:hypothetical protein
MKHGKTGENSEEREKIRGTGQDLCEQSQLKALFCTGLAAMRQMTVAASNHQ